MQNIKVQKEKESIKEITGSERDYGLILENINDMIIILNQNYEFEFINKTVTTILLGYSDKDLIGKSVLEILHPDDLNKALKTLENGFKTGEGMEEVRVRRKNGRWIWLDVKCKIFLDKNRKKKALLVARDITDKKLSEQRLRESEENYPLITENVYDLIAVFNNQFEFEYLNKQVHKEILGYEREDLIGNSALSYIHPEDFKKTIKKWRSGAKFGVGTVELRFRKKDESYMWLEIRGNQFTDKEGTIKTIVISRDITNRKEAEEKLKKSEEKYRNAYSLVNFYKDLFAHDMNNILQGMSSIVNYCIRFRNNPEILKKLGDIYEVIQNQIERGTSLISKVRYLSRLEESEINLKPIKIINVLKKSIENVKNSFPEKKISIKIEGLTKDLKILGDELLIDVFDNILNNAVKFNINKGDVVIEIIGSKVQKKDKNYIKLEFKDRGIGISDDQKKTLFKELYKREISKRGMGIGLSLVHKIVESYKGDISVKDRIRGNYNKGCNFIILLEEIS
ncbi:MAG: PAS domain S-box protein [Candidatus Hermodarchaeota archaeon]